MGIMSQSGLNLVSNVGTDQQLSGPFIVFEDGTGEANLIVQPSTVCVLAGFAMS